VDQVIDTEGRARLRRRLEEAVAAGCVRLVLECSRVQHIDEGAVADLSHARAELGRYGGTLVVQEPSWAFTRVVQRSGYPELLDPDPSDPSPPAADQRPAVQPVDLVGRLAARVAQRRSPGTGRHRRPGTSGVLVAVGRRHD
jgi:anti-anti-sigma regulatory factor